MKRLIFIFLLCTIFSASQAQIIRANPFAKAIVTSSPAGPEQNLILYSETIGDWSRYPEASVTDNQMNDLNGQPTLDFFTAPTNVFWCYQNISTNISTSTDYVISFEVAGDFDGDNVLVQVSDVNDNSLMLNQAYGSSVTASVQRLSFEFTTESSLPSGIQVSIVTNEADASPSDVYIGRVHLYQGNIGDKSYVTTTTSQVP